MLVLLAASSAVAPVERASPERVHIVALATSQVREALAFWLDKVQIMMHADAEAEYDVHISHQRSSSALPGEFRDAAWREAVLREPLAVRDYARRHKGDIIVGTDLDVVPIRPYSQLGKLVVDGQIRFMDERIEMFGRGKGHCNTGFYVFRSSDATLALLDVWLDGLRKESTPKSLGNQDAVHTLGLCRHVLPAFVVTRDEHGRFKSKDIRAETVAYHAIGKHPTLGTSWAGKRARLESAWRLSPLAALEQTITPRAEHATRDSSVAPPSSPLLPPPLVSLSNDSGVALRPGEMGGEEEAKVASPLRCDLARLAAAGKVHLHAVLDLKQRILSRHWFAHYHTALGVPLSAFTLHIITTDAPAALAYVAELHAFGVSDVRWTNATWCGSCIAKVFEQQLKTLPPEHYFFTPDVDEMYECASPPALASVSNSGSPRTCRVARVTRCLPTIHPHVHPQCTASHCQRVRVLSVPATVRTYRPVRSRP
jgi:hypothetical protein